MICHRLEQRSKVTPDFSHLALRKEIPLFVYGEELPQGHLAYLLGGAKHYGLAHTVTDKYQMKQSKMLRNPVVFDVPESEPHKAKIRGRLYGVSVEHIHVLDVAKANWKEHYRTERMIFCETLIPGLKIIKGFSTLKAFMYLGVPKFWDTQNLISKTSVKYSWWTKMSDTPFFHHTNYYDTSQDRSDLLNDDDWEARWNGWGHGRVHVG